MKYQLIAALREITPPILRRGMKSLAKATERYWRRPGRERDASFYDAIFQRSPAYRVPYVKSPFYFLWCAVVDRIIRSGAAAVLDIGCGPGQVAAFLRDRGLKRYFGFDLSPVAIEMATSVCPEFNFRVASALDTDALATVEYDTAICLEFLEHVTDDLHVLKRLRAGTRLLASVPDFAHAAHVRFFSSADEVLQRYGPLFDRFSVDAFVAPFGGTFFLMDGLKV